MKPLAAILCALILSGCASLDNRQHAYVGVAADGVSTAIALSAPNIVEANPLGWWTLPLRIGIIEYAKTLPPHEGVPVLHATEAVGWGAAVNNLLVFAGVQAAPVIGLAVGLYLWHQGSDEREFMRACAVQRELAGKALVCDWKP